MGILNLFRRRWTGHDMGHDDRLRIFYFLKRKTSYTAWQREANAFDGFVSILKKQVEEQPHAPGNPFGPVPWDKYYPEVLKVQVLYKQGLGRLCHGDRSIWLYNERGLLRDATMLGNVWYEDLVQGGVRGDLSFHGKYLEEMRNLLKIYYVAGRDTGYVQSRMDKPEAPEFWGEYMQCVLANQGYSLHPGPGGVPQKYASHIDYPEPLPDVPEPDQQVLVKTGEDVPYFGIYEPQVKDGCMNYLLKDTPAPSLMVEGTDAISVTWRLLWEDKRYLDEQIPAEERNYFSSEDKAQSAAHAVAVSDMPTLATGQLCNREGDWAVMDDMHGKLRFQLGDKLPQWNSRDVYWVWLTK